MTLGHQDTIVAIASPAGQSRRGLMRLSTLQFPDAIRRWFSPWGSASDGLPWDRPRQSVRVRLQPDGWHDPVPVLACWFSAPESYTGQNVLEIETVGHPMLLNRLLLATTQAGVRMADPGEFTFRAYLNGKLDLTQAEGVAATIAAGNDAQLRAASLLRQGHLGKWSHRLAERLADLLALVEAGIDFTDQEDVVAISPENLLHQLKGIQNELHDRLTKSRSWQSLSAMPQVVLAGRPSCGKSSLFNAMLNRPRAVTDAAPGTTRDVLAESLTLTIEGQPPMTILLQDVAGLPPLPPLPPASTACLDGSCGKSRSNESLPWRCDQAARQAIEQADLVLMLLGPESLETIDSLGLPPNIPRLVLQTKADLPSSVQRPHNEGSLPISSVTGQGLGELRRRIVETLSGRTASLSADCLAIQPRHEESLRSTLQSIRQAVTQVEPWRSAGSLPSSELVAEHLRQALQSLGSVGGQMTPDEVIGRVFSRFCVGK